MDHDWIIEAMLYGGNGHLTFDGWLSDPPTSPITLSLPLLALPPKPAPIAQPNKSHPRPDHFFLTCCTSD